MMAKVITITEMPESVKLARRCIASASKYGVSVEVWQATTPSDKPLKMLKEMGFPTDRFVNNRWSRPPECAAAFLSHYRLWCECVDKNEHYLILEHDAVFQAPLPAILNGSWACNLGRPSFGRFNIPKRKYGPLRSKAKLPGAHAYYVTPAAARAFVIKARTNARPTDSFLSLREFPKLTEYYPWPIIADDSFSTIQTAAGCRSKHNKVRPIWQI